MPFDKLSLAGMTAVNEEYLDIGSIAERFTVHNRTIKRLIEEFAKKLKRHRRRRGREFLYLWSDILKCAKIHLGIEQDEVPSVTIKKAFTKQRVKELEAVVERLSREN